MSDQHGTPQPLVSLQDAVAGHLAWGRLVYSDLVVVGGPPTWWSGDSGLHVLLTPPPPGDPARAERIGVSGMQLRGIENRPDLQFTSIQLVRPSSWPDMHPPLEEVFLRPLRNEEKIRLVLDAVEGDAARCPPADPAELPAPAAAAEEVREVPPLEDRCISEDWVSNVPPRSILCIFLGFRRCS